MNTCVYNAIHLLWYYDVSLLTHFIVYLYTHNSHVQRAVDSRLHVQRAVDTYYKHALVIKIWPMCPSVSPSVRLSACLSMPSIISYP